MVFSFKCSRKTQREKKEIFLLLRKYFDCGLPDVGCDSLFCCVVSCRGCTAVDLGLLTSWCCCCVFIVFTVVRFEQKVGGRVGDDLPVVGLS